MSFRFQHLESVPLGDQFIVIGRCADGKSIAVHIDDCHPHVVIKVSELKFQNSQAFEDDLNEKLRWKKALNDAGRELRMGMPYITNVHAARFNTSSKPAKVYELKGQDVMNYNEDGPVRFFKIVLESKYSLYDLKKILSGGYIPVITQQISWTNNTQLVDDSFPHRFPKKYKGGFYNTGTTSQSTYFGYGRELTVYNNQVDYMLQYFIDRDIYSCAWIDVKGVQTRPCLTSCDIEIDCIKIKQSEDQSGVAPWRIFSYDIESLPPPRVDAQGGHKKDEKGKLLYDFPVAEKDPVVTIGGVLQTGTDLTQYVWILRDKGLEVNKLPAFPETQDCAYAPEITKVYDFQNELEMLEDFFDWCVTNDIDIIQGHNVNRFDNAYMLTRYTTIAPWTMQTKMQTKEKRPTLPVWGRMRQKGSKIEKKTFSSSQKGTNIQYRLHLPGRVVIDSYDIMKDQHNESSYKLDDLAQTYLGTKKVPMDYDMIYPKYQTMEGRRELAIYCVKDSWLVYKLMDKLCKQTVLFQMANVTGISLKDVINRGQGIRTIALMLRYAKERRPQLMLPKVKYVPKKRRHNEITLECGLEAVESEVEHSFQGAVVVDPSPGLYTDSIISCLDFASLYPSIMRAMNMSYETLCDRTKIEQHNWQQDVDVRTIPDYEMIDGVLQTTIDLNNPSFITKEKRLGLLPEILQKVLAERKAVKKKMKQETPHSTMYKVYDGRQLGLKVVANSVYGFTGATHGILPCKTIAESVTKFGRGMILQTKSMVENHPVWGRGGHNATCIYGDTDSVFVKVPRSLVNGANDEDLIKNAHAFGEVMANKITDIFLAPNELEYEKSYKTFLLLCKKRYAGMKYEPGLPPKMQMKGVECVRRDFAPIVVDTQKAVLEALLQDGDLNKAVKIVRDTVARFYADKIPLEKLIMSKKLSRPPEQYKVKAAHVQLTCRLMKEGKPHAVSGDRVDYIIYEGTGKMSERACTVQELKDGKFALDRSYYLNKQLIPPLKRVFQIIKDAPDDLFKCKTRVKKSGVGSNSIFKSWSIGRTEKKEENTIKEECTKKKKTQATIINFFK